MGLLQEMLHPTEGMLASVSNPTEWSSSPPEVRRHAPTLGEHTLEVFREAGIDEATIQQSLHHAAIGAA